MSKQFTFKPQRSSYMQGFYEGLMEAVTAHAYVWVPRPVERPREVLYTVVDVSPVSQNISHTLKEVKSDART